MSKFLTQQFRRHAFSQLSASLLITTHSRTQAEYSDDEENPLTQTVTMQTIEEQPEITSQPVRQHAETGAYSGPARGLTGRVGEAPLGYRVMLRAELSQSVVSQLMFTCLTTVSLLQYTSTSQCSLLLCL